MDMSFVDALKAAYSNAGTNSPTQIAKHLKQYYPLLSDECLRGRVRRFLRTHSEYSEPMENTESNSSMTTVCDLSIGDNITKSVEYKADGSIIFDRIIALSNADSLTPANILKAHGMDISKWDIISCKSNLWQQQKKDGNVLNLYQSKITVRPSANKISISDIKNHFENWNPICFNFEQTHNRRASSNRHYMYEVNIADLHLGKFSSKAETGEYLNTDIAIQRFKQAIESECRRIEALDGEIDKILFVWSNDFFNSDGISNSTTGGTAQDTDMKWQELFLTGIDLLVSAIQKLSEYAPVKTFYVASNHSRQVDYYAICTLQAYFRNVENVEIDVTPSPRHYERYGVNLIGFAHSYYEKKNNLPYLMSVEQPEDWGQTKYREYHLAHYHSEKVEEKGGIIFRWLPSITGEDTWTTECGYVGAVKRTYSFVYDRDLGMIQMNSTIVD